MKNLKPSVLACVTGQYDCDRIIRIAKLIADSNDCELRVLSVITPQRDYSKISNQIEYLYSVSKEANSDMTILFDKNAAKATADFVSENQVQRIVTGMHDGKIDSFLVKFNELSPDTSITMISKDSKVYSMDLCNCYS